jgi:hypothetical protein
VTAFSNVGRTGKLRLSLSFAFLIGAVAIAADPVTVAAGATRSEQITRHEAQGDLAGARTLLEQEANDPGNTSAAADLAQFLDRHGDVARRNAYLKWASAEADPQKRKLALRQAVLIDLIDNKKTDLAADLQAYKAAGGSDLAVPGRSATVSAYSTVTLPGPLSSFARMAALAPDLGPEDLLPALARNIVTNGYEATGNESLQPTEYLRLLMRYVGQARELQSLAGAQRKIVIPTCDSTEAADLLKVIGYRMRGSCGADIVLETVNPTRAFITVDSGFPLTQLEQDLRANRRFELPYAPTVVPVLYDQKYWLSATGRADKSDFLDAFTADAQLCRLYLGLSHVESPVAEALRKQANPLRLRLSASVLDFYGGMFAIRNGAVVTPGPAKVWSSIVGAPATNPGAFFEKLLTTDDGWLASYFDAVSRVDNPRVVAYLTHPDHLKRFYDALRGKVTTPGPARPVFRSSTEIMLLTTSLRLDGNGQAHIPGSLDVWRTLFIKHPHGKYDGKLTRSAAAWRNGDDLIEALFGLSRKTADNDPLKIFLAVNDVERERAQPLSAELTARLINDYHSYGGQYRIFAETPTLSETSITNYLSLCSEVSSNRDTSLRANAAGMLQATVELWSILQRQGAIAAENADGSFSKSTQAFAHVKGETELFSAGRTAVTTLLSAAHTEKDSSYQAQMVELLVGKMKPAENEAPSTAETFLRMFDAQRLISLDALFAAADRAGKGSLDKKMAKAINDQLNRMQETETLHASASREERSSLAQGYWSDRHIEQERKFDLESLLKGGEKKDVRNALTAFLRDTMVGLVYCYYAPPGAQVLLTNPMFVRSHDFIGPESSPALWRTTEVSGSGWPANSGGRLSGSLVTLPYALAQAEQNFLSPRKEQALIWADLVPQVIMNVTVTRWRNVSSDQIRWVALHIQRGQNLLASAALDSALEPRVMDSLGRFMTPVEVERLRNLLRAGEYAEATAKAPPSYLYALADDPKLKNEAPDIASLQIAAMEERVDPKLKPAAIAATFGTAKPTLTHSFAPRLLYLRTFPALMGFSSRILAETWESNNLYYAALADQVGIPVEQLESSVREWNRSAIENIFATHLEDWPAIIRSLKTTSDGVLHRNSQRAAVDISRN